MKKMLLAAALAVLPIQALAGSITFTVVQGGQSNATRTYTVPDAELTRLVAAYQSAANVSVNGTATRGQVLNYILNDIWIKTIIEFVKNVETNAARAAVPDATPINPQ